MSFMSALAQQCFLNEYVFSISEAEQAARQELEDVVGASLAEGRGARAVAVLALAMYAPLKDLRFADALASAKWPQAVSDVVAQQIGEPATEERLRSGIQRLTSIDDDTSTKVRTQYEENPYPRWVRLGSPPPVPLDLDGYVRQLFPVAPFRPVAADERLDVLVAGCGTGRHALELAQSFRGARVLGIDLSVASLAAAARRIPPHLLGTVEFAQADILGLRDFQQRFDFISAGGVLHHMADALEGWRILLGLLKPNGLMQVALYSRYARRGILEARDMIARRGYRPTVEDIRRLRADLRARGEAYDFMSLDDFFSTSECRDLLFHVHESQFTIPELKAFFAENNLRFIGFQFGTPAAHQFYRDRFARSGWSFSDLDRWDAYERENPTLFAGMYIFWIQKDRP
jgi:SAM-dependent methyltransferase